MADDGILFSEWAAQTPSARLLGAGFDRPACPICGHPTGDCTHDAHQEVAMTQAKKATAKKAAAKKAAAPSKAADDKQSAAPAGGDEQGSTEQAAAATPGVTTEGIARAGTTPEAIEAAEKQRKANEEADAARFPNAGVEDPVEIKEGGKVKSSVYKTLEAGDEFVEITEDVVEEFYFPDTQRPSSRLLFTKGQIVRKAAIDEHNARVEAAKK